MKILLKIIDLNKATDKINMLGFVPTMGALHKGHISLIKKSQKRCKKTLVSIFVNPTQFDNKTDFSNYPKKLKKDLSLLKKMNVNYVFIPSITDVYSYKRLKKITLKKSDKILCAKYRKGHFEGVLDVMDRLIKVIKPREIYMGEKDFQQVHLIKKFIKNRYNSKIICCPTIRDKNKIALSSRNLLLNEKNLQKLSMISKDLLNFKKKISFNSKSLSKLLDDKKKDLKKKFNIKIQYLELRDAVNLRRTFNRKQSKLFFAFFINTIRLIDNF
jgi:pantoate--beta-alanine ligase